MKITKKRLLKWGFEKQLNGWFDKYPMSGYTIWIKLDSKTATIERDSGEIERTSFDDVYAHGGIEGWFEDVTTFKITLPTPKKRSLKKAVKGLKKKLKELNTNYELLEERVEDLEVVLEDIKGDFPCSPTSAENAQVENPIEFGGWVEVVEGDENTPIGERGVFHYKELGLATFVTKALITRTCPIESLKRIKSPIE